MFPPDSTTTRITLRRRSPSSYGCMRIEALADWLTARGWGDIPTTNIHEYARLKTARGQIIILFSSGTVLVQGQHADETHAQIAPLVQGGAA